MKKRERVASDSCKDVEMWVESASPIQC